MDYAPCQSCGGNTCSRLSLKEVFTQSSFDPCLLYQQDMIIVIYVHDVGIKAKHPKEVDAFVDNMKK